MQYYTKEGLKMCGKGLTLATIGASSQALMTIGASMVLQVPLVLGFGYVMYSTGKQLFKFSKNEYNNIQGERIKLIQLKEKRKK